MLSWWSAFCSLYGNFPYKTRGGVKMGFEQLERKKRQGASVREDVVSPTDYDPVEQFQKGEMLPENGECDATGDQVKPKRKRKKNDWSLGTGEHRYKNFIVRGSELFVEKKDKDGNWQEYRIGNLVFVKEIHENIDNQTVSLLLRYRYNGNWRELPVKRSQIQPNELMKLLDHGLDVHEHKVKKVAEFLSLQEEDAPVRYFHEQLGWMQRDGGLVYKHQQVIGTNFPYSSAYIGNLLLQSGTIEGWTEVIKQEVLGHTPLEFALVCGFASPVVSLIARDLDMEVLICHAYGDSSQGKTTAGRVMVSPFGCPNRQEGGLMLHWKGTQNGMVAQIAGKHGIPLVFDEASMNRLKDFTEMLYLLAEGREKARMTKEMQLRTRASWSGLFFSTAEHSLRHKSNRNSGLIVRLFEKGNVRWTRSAENAENIREGLLQHYGHAGPKFVEYLIQLGKEAIFGIWKKWASICYNKMEYKDGLSNRIADKYALILATAELMNKCFDFQVNIDGILDFLLEMDQENVEGRDLGEQAYQYLKQMVIQHQMNFIKTDYTPKGEIWGKIARCLDKRVEVAFLQEPFKKLLSDGGFDDCTVVLRKLKEKGYLDHERNKNTRKRNIDPSTDTREFVYCVRFDKSFKNLLSGVTLSSSQVKSASRKTSENTAYPPDDKDFPDE